MNEEGPTGVDDAPNNEFAAIANLAWDKGENPSTIIVEEISSTLGEDPLDLPPLYEYIDPEALDTLLHYAADHQIDDTEVAFNYCDYSINIVSNGYLSIFKRHPTQSVDVE